MRRPVQLEVMRRLFDEIGSPVEGGEPMTTPLSVDRYLDPQQFEAEQHALFRRQPLIVGHVSDLPEVGSFVTERIGGVPVLLLRGEDGVRAFANVCRHRGALLMEDEAGCRKALTCRYHAWTYDLAGRIIHIPHQESFGEDFDPASRGLRELACELRHGFVWVRVEGEGPLDVAASLGAELDDDLAGFELDEHHARRTVHHERNANWKLVMDAFAEGYHLKSLHQASLARFFLETTVLDHWSPHIRQVGARKAMRDAASQPADAWDLRDLTTVFYNVFPNIVFVVHPLWITQMSLFPESVDRVRVVHRMLVREKPQSDEQATRLDKSFTHIDGQVFQKEDLSIAESIQATLASGTDRDLLMGGMETGMRLFHEARDRALREL